MCIIIIKPQGETIPEEILEQSYYLNDDGFGFYSFDDSPIVYRTQNYEEFKPELDKHNNERSLLIVHYRLNTAGNNKDKNVHPFRLKDGWHMFHNGTFSHATYHKNLSDTNIISRKIRAFENMDNNMGQISDLLQNLTDSRVVFVKKDEYYIVNEKSGIWYDGLWLSKDNVLKNIPVFVYGTLRKHGSNYYSYMTKSKYLGEAETILKYNIREKGLPFLTKENKHHVKGDLFMVSQTQLEDIDILEGHPNFYKREKIKVKSKHGTFDAWAYFNDGERIGKSTDEYVDVFQHDDINYYQPDDLTPLEEIDNLDKLKREYSRCYGEPFPIDFADYAAEMLGYSTLTQNTWEKMPMHSRRMLLEEIYFEF